MNKKSKKEKTKKTSTTKSNDTSKRLLKQTTEEGKPHAYIVFVWHTGRGGGIVTICRWRLENTGSVWAERKLSPHEQKLWPLAIRRGGGGGSGSPLFGADGLSEFQALLIRLASFYLFLFTYIFVLVTPSFSTKELFSCKMCCVRDFVCVDKMGLVSLSTRSKAKWDRRQNTVDFGSEICQTFDWFPPPCKICQGASTMWPLVGHQINLWVLRMEGIWSVEQKKWYSESWTKWRQPQSGFTPNYVFKLPPINPFVTYERGPKGLKATGGKKRVLAKPWLMAKYGTKGSMFHFIQPLTKNVENHQLFGSWIKPHCGLKVNFTAM